MRILSAPFVILSFFNLTLSENVITFFVKKLEPELQTPLNHFEGIDKRIVKNVTHVATRPLFATYFGYLTLSDRYGRITFPRKTAATKFNLLVTNKAEPIFMFPNTIFKWQIPLLTAAKMYKIERISKGAKYYWQITPVTLKNRDIPLQTIIIFAKPDNVIVPVGKIPTGRNIQLVLPDIYIKEKYNSNEVGLFILQISQFFKQVHVE